MTETVSRPLSPRERGKCRELLPNALLRGHLEGNARIPQTDFGAGVFITRAIVDSPDPEKTLRTLSLYSLSDQQRILTIRQMHVAHGSNGIDLQAALANGSDSLLGQRIDMLWVDMTRVVISYEHYWREIYEGEINMDLYKDVVTTITESLRSGKLAESAKTFRTAIKGSRRDIPSAIRRSNAIPPLQRAIVEFANQTLVDSKAQSWVKRVVDAR